MPKEKIKVKVDQTDSHFSVVGIGASAGGLDAFKKLLKEIPPNSGMAFVLVQHLDPSHASNLPEILQKVTPLPISEISDNTKVEPNHIYVIPSNKMVLATDGGFHLSPRPDKAKHELNFPIDVFFSSLAEVYQANAIGVVLSGTASDGTLGLKAIKDNGGVTFAQDQASAEFEGMPHNAVEAGVVDFILPPEAIPAKLMDITGWINQTDEALQHLPVIENEIFKQILALLKIRKGTDFTFYKQTTIRRRILRRVALSKNENSAAYLAFLRDHPAEQDILYQDLLIPVTSFFRDPDSFENLYETVFPEIIKNKKGKESIRLWSAGCSTGEEAFSLAICIKEFLNKRNLRNELGEKLNHEINVQIFATDISEPAISKARKGIYSKSELTGLGPQRIEDFFVKVNGGYQVGKGIRDMCVFAVHNFLKDPPFAKMDLVTCRNVLIYMEPYLQKKALTTFHYALNTTGFLLLGKSETSSSVPDLFAMVGKNDKLFSRKNVPSRYIQVAGQRKEQAVQKVEEMVNIEGKLPDFQKSADDILLSKFTPAGVVVNEAMEIVHFRGAIGAYLEPLPGKASLNLLKMIKEGLAFELRNILHKAKTEKVPIVKENILAEINGAKRNITIEAIPLTNIIEPHYLVLFHDKVEGVVPVKLAGRKLAQTKQDEKDLRIHQLEQELSQLRDDMRTISEDQEAVNEELQSANEELLSGSEELQSLNEELETSKEELQSANEELILTNQEMASLNELVTAERNYAEAIVTTIREPLIILDKNQRVKTANASFYQTFMVTKAETEGKLFFDLGNRQWDIPELRTLLENILPFREKFADFEINQKFPHIGERIMLLNARILKETAGDENLLLLAIEDITDKSTAENMLIESEKKFRTLANFIPQIIWTALPDGKVDYQNLQWHTFFQYNENKIDKGFFSLVHEEDRQKVIDAWSYSLKTGEKLSIENRLKDKQTDSYRWFLLKACSVKDEKGKIVKWFGSITDIHEQKIFAAELLASKQKAEDAVKAKQQFLSHMSHEIRTPMNSIIGFTKVVLRTDLEEKQREYVNAIKKSGDVLLVLINDILDLAKVDAGKMTFENKPFKLADTVSAMLHLFELQLKEKNIAVVKDFDNRIPEVLSGDPVRLHQVILNLMSNAVKFTKEGTISIGVKLQQEEGEKLTIEFSVADTGIGIAENKLGLLFESFQQAHKWGGQYFGGTGLGLSIAKKLVEAQGGSMGVKSKLSVGSVFSFTLIFQKTSESPEIEEEEWMQGIANQNSKILLVEDNALNQLLIKTLMADFGFELDIVDNGKLAIEKLTSNLKNLDKGYDIILMDLLMPEMDGFETSVYIRNELQLDIPIIALTANITSSGVRKCIEVGMNDYISKPIDEKLLFRKIIHWLKLPLGSQGYRIPTAIASDSINDKCTDLSYLKRRTKNDTALTAEMIRIYLKQTPELINAIKEGIEKKDWSLLYAAAHKLLPSFAIMGIDPRFEEITKKIQEYAGSPEDLSAVQENVASIEAICKQAIEELELDLKIL